jgi:hypothetical protein
MFFDVAFLLFHLNLCKSYSGMIRYLPLPILPIEKAIVKLEHFGDTGYLSCSVLQGVD